MAGLGMSLLMSLQAAIMRTRLEMASHTPCRALDRSTCLEIEKSSRFYKIVERIAAPEIQKFRNKFLLQLKQHFRFSQSLLTLDSILLLNPNLSPNPSTRYGLKWPKMTRNGPWLILNLHFNSRFLQRWIGSCFVSIIAPTWSSFVLHIFSNRISKHFSK